MKVNKTYTKNEKNRKHKFFSKIKMKGEKLIELGKESLTFTKILRGKK